MMITMVYCLVYVYYGQQQSNDPLGVSINMLVPVASFSDAYWLIFIFTNQVNH